MDLRIRLISFLLAASLGCSSTTQPADTSADRPAPLAPGSADRGAVLGRKLCTSCHGADGRGRGEAAEGLDPPPRSFVHGVYRYRSSPGGSLPTDWDLARTIIVGLPGTSMPGYGNVLSSQDVRDLVAWVKQFSSRFFEEQPAPPVVIPEPPPVTAETVARGRELYEQLQCALCHGDDGSGDGPLAKLGMRDSLGRPVKVRDLKNGIYRSGNTQRDLYRALATGLDGSPMPGYAALPAEDLYSLVHYLYELEARRGFWFWLTRRPRWYEPPSVTLER